jgi:hypothetical protein
MYMQHVIGVNLGPPIAAEYKKDGHFQPVTKPKGTISLYPGHHPFSRRVRKVEKGTTDVLYAAVALYSNGSSSICGLARRWGGIRRSMVHYFE